MNFALFLKEQNIKYIVIHGLYEHLHTHKYIHDAIYKALTFVCKDMLDIKILRCDDTIESLQLYEKKENYLVFSSPQQHSHTYLPIKDNIHYVLHYNYIFQNKEANQLFFDKYGTALKNKKALLWLEFRRIVKGEQYRFLDNTNIQYYDIDNHAVHMPWGTNLLPDEINKNIEKISVAPQYKKSSGMVFIGSIWFRNENEMKILEKSCTDSNISCKFLRIEDEEEHSRMIRESLIAPSIQGALHCISEDSFYIPCRIFKNISFGSLPITNNIGVYNLFKDYLIMYDTNIDTLIKKSVKFQEDNYDDYATYKKELIRVMEYVRDNHTYVNRLNNLATCFGL